MEYFFGVQPMSTHSNFPSSFERLIVRVSDSSQSVSDIPSATINGLRMNKINITIPPVHPPTLSTCLHPPLSLTLCHRHSPLHKQDKSSQTNFSSDKSATTQTSPSTSLLMCMDRRKQRKSFRDILSCKGVGRSSAEMGDDQELRKDEEEDGLDGRWLGEIRNWDYVESYLLRDDQGQVAP
jgi:hypothetical protein